jgi:hypothetical protein
MVTVVRNPLWYSGVGERGGHGERLSSSLSGLYETVQGRRVYRTINNYTYTSERQAGASLTFSIEFGERHWCGTAVLTAALHSPGRHLLFVNRLKHRVMLWAGQDLQATACALAETAC